MAGQVPLSAPHPKILLSPSPVSPGTLADATGQGKEVSAVPCSGDSVPRQVASLAPRRPVGAGWGPSPGKEGGLVIPMEAPTPLGQARKRLEKEEGAAQGQILGRPLLWAAEPAQTTRFTQDTKPG